MRVIDLRSDTVTQPSQRMRMAMSVAIVGDDVYQEDPTVTHLESTVAQLFGKESALFFPTGTMSNLTALLTWCPRRDSEVIIGNNSHIFLYEQTGACQYGGISLRTVPNFQDGTMDLSEIEKSIREDDIHEPVTCLICVENTHNACGGKVLPFFFLEKLNAISKTTTRKIPIHMDGARVWNAITAMNCQPTDIAKYADSITVCLSKGLGCPAGSLLLGNRDFIQRARRIRKSLGGGMRQSGILAAAGLVALDEFKQGLLREDHRRTSLLVQGLLDIPLFEPYEPVETNILFLQINPLPLQTLLLDKEHTQKITEIHANEFVLPLKEKGILISAWTPKLIRMVVHRDITDENIYNVIRAFHEIFQRILTYHASTTLTRQI